MSISGVLNSLTPHRDSAIQAPHAYAPFFLASLAAETPVLAVTASVSEAEDLTRALQSFLPQESVSLYPAWETLPHERLSPSSSILAQRISVMHRVHRDPTLRVIVAPARSYLQPQPRELGKVEPLTLEVGKVSDLDELATALTLLGYERTDLVGARGQFAVRGGILDIFPPTEEHPVRVEFFGDDIEEIRHFSITDQRSLERVQGSVTLPACREILLTDEVRARAAELSTQHPELAEMLSRIADGISVEGMESLTPALLEPDALSLMVESMPPQTRVVVIDPEKVRRRAEDLTATSEEFRHAAWSALALTAGNTHAPIDLGLSSFRSLDDAQKSAESHGFAHHTLQPFGISDSSVVTAAPAFQGDVAAAADALSAHQKDNWRIVAVFSSRGALDRTAEQLGEHGCGVRVAEELRDAPEPGSITFTLGYLPEGITDEASRTLVLSETDLTGVRAQVQRRRLSPRRGRAIDLTSLKTGEYVVHETHGVGRFVEMQRRVIGGAEREYVVLEYAASKRGQPGDKLFVPTDALDQLTRYVGGDAPTLHRIGGSDWQRTKSRARKAVKEIAGELIRLYAARSTASGHAFAPDTVWQREMEDAFGYTETIDQLGAVEDVKRDMEKPVPMDRIICGDVGFGKTEIAVRAVFKAVQDGKQVAVLVPTTLLARQHFQTFTERMGQFPVRIAQLSRFQTDKEAHDVLAQMADGSVDIVIGTHRLLSSRARFKNLALVVVDEEQRFGVEHKEFLKHMRTNVDVLTMSATPIPRTLEMSLTGIREMSTIATPPEERHPVLTYVGSYDQEQIRAAIHRELIRDGQVFYIHNRVESIEKAAARIRSLVPEARVEVGHGQMAESQLERVMLGFWEKRCDVLVCTTIVESGLDIPNANTLIVERADMFGLSQLHQIRGRVGRGRERGYAYFLYPPEKPLTETAHERLATVAQHSELGAGMFVAQKDLEIRGAGNLLGGEQSGQIAAVGFDLYVRMVSEAVAEFKGEQPAEPVEMKVDIPVNASIPPAYIASERLRLEMYRRASEVESQQALQELREEIIDRYGALPEVVENVLAVAGLRLKARRCGVREIVTAGKSIRLSPVQLPESRSMRVSRLYSGAVHKAAAGTLSVPAPRTARVGGVPVRDRDLVIWLEELLDIAFG